MDNRLINLINPIWDYVLLNPELSIQIDYKGVEIKQILKNQTQKKEDMQEIMYQQNPEEPILLGIKELSEKLGLGRNVITKLSKIKGFPIIKNGNRNKYILSEVIKWLKNNKGVKL